MLIVTLAGAYHQRTATSPGKLCVPSTDSYWPGLMGYLRNFVSNPKLAGMRTVVMLPAVDPSLIRAVQSDSLCSLAVIALNDGRPRPDSASHPIYLVRVGEVYYAIDRKIRAGEYVMAAVLDSTLTKILSRPTK